MAFYELIVLKPGGGPEVRYTDRPFKVGQRFEIDLRPFVVVTQTASPRNPDAVQGFVCAAPTEATTPDSSAGTRRFRSCCHRPVSREPPVRLRSACPVPVGLQRTWRDADMAGRAAGGSRSPPRERRIRQHAAVTLPPHVTRACRRPGREAPVLAHGRSRPTELSWLSSGDAGRE